MSLDSQIAEIDLERLRVIPSERLEELAVRPCLGHALTLIHDAGSGHPGGALNKIRPLVIYYHQVHQKERPKPILSGGHCCPASYAIHYEFGNLTLEKMAKFRRIEGPSGHADRLIQPVPTGLLGQGPGIACGMALAEKQKGTNYKTYVFIGDGELDEPAVWGAIEYAGNNELPVNFVVSYNRKNLTGNLVRDFEKKVDAAKSFGCYLLRTKSTIKDLSLTYERGEGIDGPAMIIVDELKGAPISFMMKNSSGWHGDPLPDDKYQEAMAELGLKPTTFRSAAKEENAALVTDSRKTLAIARLKEQGFGTGKPAPTRDANTILAELGNDYKNLVVLIPDLGKSVKMDKFAETHPDRFFDVGIDEMTATLAGIGLSASDFKPVISTFDGFTYIPFSAIRMADYGAVPFLGFVFTHAEFLGEDGPSHSLFENLGAWRGLYNLKTIANPADKIEAEKILRDSVNEGGMFYLRLGRPNVPTIYTERQLPQRGKADVLVSGAGPLIITTGQEVWESLLAAEMLRQDGYSPEVINVSYFRPFDRETICREAAGKKIFITEAHKSDVGLAGIVTYELGINGIGHQGIVPLGVLEYVPSGSIAAQKQFCGLLGEQIYARIRDSLPEQHKA